MLEPRLQRDLLALARAAVQRRVRASRMLPPPARDWPPPLARPCASFVTLTVDGELRGCCGTIEPRDALADDVWRNAQRSASEDARFAALRPGEEAACALEIAVLGPLEPLVVPGEQALIAALRPGVDGLLMACDERRATFLPTVWRKVPDPATFVRHLKHKMGLPPDFWHERLVFHRYATQAFEEAAADT